MVKKEIENICIYGVGGVGGYFGAKIIDENKNDKLKVSFIARGGHFKEIEKNGLTLKTEGKVINVKPFCIKDDINEIEKIDLLLICVKSYDLDEVIEKIDKKINEDTIIIPLLNGVDIYERIRKKLKKGIVLPACVYVGTHIEKEGVIFQKGGDGKIIFGKDPKYKDFEPIEVINIFEKTKVNFIYQENPYKEIWTKYMFISGYGLVTAKTGKTLGEVLENDELIRDVKGIMTEIRDLADKNGVELDADVILKSLEKAKSFPYETKTSFQRDVENLNKRNEKEIFANTIIRLGLELNVKTEFTHKYL